MVCDRCCVGWLKNNLKIVSFRYVILLMLIIFWWLTVLLVPLVYFRLLLSCQERECSLQSSIPLKLLIFLLYLEIYFLARATPTLPHLSFSWSRVKFCKSRAASLEAKNPVPSDSAFSPNVQSILLLCPLSRTLCLSLDPSTAKVLAVALREERLSRDSSVRLFGFPHS